MNIGIIGNGFIVHWFIEAARQVKGMEIAAICGREKSLDKLHAVADKYSIPQVCTDRAKLLRDSKIDAVYVGLSNHMHYEAAKEAILAGKNVIIEKPFTANADQAKELTALAKEKNVFLFEAAPNRYFPTVQKAKELLPRIGRIRVVQLNYSQYSSRYDKFKKGEILPAFDPKCAGGAIMDLGIYNIHFVLTLFGKPDKITYHANIEKGIDTSGILFMEYPDFKVVCIGAKDCNAPVSINIQGDTGCIHTTSAPNVIDKITLTPNDGAEETCRQPAEMRMVYELQQFSEMVQKHDLLLSEKRLQQTITSMQILDEARKQAGIEIPQ